MFSMEAVCAMASVSGCQTLSTPIRAEIPNVSDGKTCRFNFAACSNEMKPERETINSTEFTIYFFHDSSLFVGHDKIQVCYVSGRKTKRFETDKKIEHIRQN